MDTTTETNVAAPTAETTPTVAKRPGRKPSPETLISFWAINGVRITQKGKPSIEMLQNRRRITMPKMETYNPDVHGLGEVDPADVLEITRRQLPKTPKAKAVTTGATMPAPQNTSSEVVNRPVFA